MWRIRGRIVTAAETLSDPVNRSQLARRQLSQLRRAENYYRAYGEGEQPSTVEIASQLNITASRLDTILKLDRPVRALEDTVDDAGRTALDSVYDGQEEVRKATPAPVCHLVISLLGTGIPALGVWCGPRLTVCSVVFVQMMVRDLMGGAMQAGVEEALSQLNAEERLVMTHRLGLVDGRTKSVEEILAMMEGCTASYFKKVETRAKANLRRNMALVKLSAFEAAPAVQLISSALEARAPAPAQERVLVGGRRR
jgi:DNA-directed RNA polymerase sigma subunit (sigma70/sigma32)